MKLSPLIHKGESVLRIDFTKAEVNEIIYICDTVGFPIKALGGLTRESPYFTVRLKQATEYLNTLNIFDMAIGKIQPVINDIRGRVISTNYAHNLVVQKFNEMPAGIFVKKETN